MSSTNAGGSGVERLLQMRTVFLNFRGALSRIKCKDLIAPAHNNDCPDNGETNESRRRAFRPYLLNESGTPHYTGRLLVAFFSETTVIN